MRHEPADARHALLHGDPNPGNYLIRDGRAVAVIDWELAGVGDPRSDLGFYAALLTIFGDWPSSDGETELSASVGAEPESQIAWKGIAVCCSIRGGRLGGRAGRRWP